VHLGRTRHETCTVLLTYPGGVVASTAVSYVKPDTLVAWDVSIFGTAGSIELSPGDLDGGSLLHHRDGHPVSRLAGAADGFARQVRAFTDAVHGYGEVRNPPADAVRDLVLCDDIEAFLTSRRTLADTTAIEAGESV
jgi:myo-inositol 2-dehydrogenase / D-chiro-inositol 1-dehydrogenase